MSNQTAIKRREALVLALAGIAAIAIPCLAQHQLDAKVHVGLAEAASQRIGLPVRLEDVTVGLTGTLEISNVQVGEFLSAKSVIASVSPARVGGHKLSANELLVRSPHALIRYDKDGNSNLDALLAKRQGARHGSRASSSRSSTIERIRLVDGSVTLEWENHGNLNAQGIQIELGEHAVHGVVGRSKLQLQNGQWQLDGIIARSAFDFDRRHRTMKRMLASGGSMKITGPESKAVVQQLTLSYGIENKAWKLDARTGHSRPNGSVRVTGRQQLGGMELQLEAKDMPLTLLGPWLPKQVTSSALVTGSATINKGKEIVAALALSFSQLELRAATLAQRPVKLDLELEAHATLVRRAGLSHLDLRLDSMRSKDLSLSGQAHGQWQPNSLVPQLAKIRLELAEVGCDAALNSLPASLRPMLAGLELRGKMHSKIEMMLSKNEASDTVLRVTPGIKGCRVVREPPSADTRSLRASYKHKTPDGQIHTLEPGSPDFSELEQMPSYVPLAFVAAEDARFFKHQGFDLHQIERSLAIDVQQERLARGGSTISQQLVKNLFLHRKRTLARKLQEAALTWRLEKNLSKNRVLEIYLNIIEFGDNTYGIRAAAQRWFAVAPSELSILQTAFLAAIVPEPTSMSARIREAGGLDPVSASRVGTILRAMKRSKVISSQEYRRAKKRPLKFASQAVVALKHLP